MRSDTAICTWFVADDAATASFFPQVGSRSDASATQAIYWRCTVCFYASSIALNPDARHIFFTNTRLPRIDGVEIAELFERWGIETVTLPITYRLASGMVSSFGNQFYIFDVIDWLARDGAPARAIVLDSDCIWLKPVDAMAAEIEASGALTYDLSTDVDEMINGRTRAQLARFLGRLGGPPMDETHYYGGEIYAARRDVSRRICERARLLWPAVLAGDPDGPLEEAHLLSLIYEIEGLPAGTADRFIRRMWTTFHYNNLRPQDEALAVWHLPVEKKTGFADLFKAIARHPEAHPARDAGRLGLEFSSYARLMGWPRRGTKKLARDLALKIREKVQQ
ncbi:hypothetical protein [Novosphingobium album (ex Liu et al. 2023)]|uniref:Glycosyl transferase n=1 Tax=Novosphingobium album (ex Liu et al. 2023) TaxID=3031130 RepID=A0ABT5WNH8_9SPHN|nr:hypothetical protein [Novosphingobium album (ex Liu et al. 2023)]MDE8650488.1 hypothetical protein [Novosphingobium album (ex Liu et al. 2023)]